MNTVPISDRLAVCSWSLQPESPAALLAHLQTIRLKRVQIALDPIRENPAVWGDFANFATANGITFASGMFGTVGEDYSTLETIKATGGLVPDAHWEQNWKNINADLEIAKTLGLKLVTFHAGFMPHDQSDPAYAKLLNRIEQVSDLFAKAGMDLAFETGQEDAPTLRDFLIKLNRPNVGVNFDPANMILYDRGEPIKALRVLGPWLKQCHIKDAIRTKVKGTWGTEVPIGRGEVNWQDFFNTLNELGFTGACCAEREAGTNRVADIQVACALARKYNS